MHFQELGIATLCSLFVNANRGKDSSPAKSSDFYHFKSEEERIRIDPSASEAFFKLAAENKLPSWAVAIAPMDELKSSRSNRSVTPIVWAGENVVLFMPRQKDGRIFAPIALIQGNEEEAIVQSDTVPVCLKFTDGQTGDRWVLDGEFLIYHTAPGEASP